MICFGLPWKWERLITLFIPGSGLYAMLEFDNVFQLTCEVLGENNGLACMLSLRITPWGRKKNKNLGGGHDCGIE